jgi:hypothetical protein
VTRKLYEAFADSLSAKVLSFDDEEPVRIALVTQTDELAVARADIQALRETVRSLSAALERKDQEVVARGELILDQADAIFVQRGRIKALEAELEAERAKTTERLTNTQRYAVWRDMAKARGVRMLEQHREIRVLKRAVASLGDELAKAGRATVVPLGCLCGGRDCPNS